jgi:Ras-related protein Rab-7A
MTKKALFKIIILGDLSVGKTSLMEQYVNQKFSQTYKATIGADFLTKKIAYKNLSIDLQFWDTAGQERFHSLGNAFYRGSDAVVFVYDVSNRKSFQSIPTWKDEFINSISSNETPRFLLLGNKGDLPLDKHSVTSDEANQFALRNNMEHFIVSAKENINIEKAFNTLTELILYNMPDNDILFESEVVDLNDEFAVPVKSCYC